MKNIILVFLTFFVYSLAQGQIKSGIYGELKLAYNTQGKIITGFYESGTGLDEQTGKPRFSCVFYIQGVYKNNKLSINTFYPLDSDVVVGQMIIDDSTHFKIKLPQEHGGCWNVQHFADGFVDFELEASKNWKEIRYITADKAYFYSEKLETGKRKVYLIKGDIIAVDRIEGNWIHCTFYGTKNTTGWLKMNVVNQL